MGLVDRLIAEAMQEANGSSSGFEKTAEKKAETPSSPYEIADQLEKLAFSGESVGTTTPVEKLLEVAAVHEAVTGENLLERIRI